MINKDKRCNDLTGKEWLQNSFSIWRNFNKTPEEKELYHQMLHIDIIGIVKRNILKRKYSIHVRETSLYLK